MLLIFRLESVHEALCWNIATAPSTERTSELQGPAVSRALRQPGGLAAGPLQARVRSRIRSDPANSPVAGYDAQTRRSRLPHRQPGR